MRSSPSPRSAGLALRPLLALLAAALLGLGSGHSAQGAQAAGGVRIREEPTDAGLRLSVENTNLAAITLTLRLTLENAAADRPLPILVSCPGRGTFAVAHVRPLDAGRGFSYRARYEWQFGSRDAVHAPGTVYELPFASGKRFQVMQGFGGTFTHTGNDHYAVDFVMPVGTPVHAAREGTVEVVVDRFKEGGDDPRLRNSVNLILVRHPDGTYGEYVHLRHKGARVRPGERVKAGDKLGESGNTGYSNGPHLHFAVFRAVDGTRRETFPIRFHAREGPAVEPVEGGWYTAR